MKNDDGDGDVGTIGTIGTIGDDVLDPRKVSLHSRVNTRTHGAPLAAAHHSDKDKLAWQRDSVDGVFAVVENIFRTKSKSFPENIFSPFSTTVRGPPLSPWQVSLP